MKALIISNRGDFWREKIECYKSFMPFLSGLVIVSPRKTVEKISALHSDYILCIDEAEFISRDPLQEYQLDGYEHASFNFILRSNIIISVKMRHILGEEFILMDDDNIPLFPIDREVFKKNNKYIGYYYQKFSSILPDKFQFKSYDLSLEATRHMLHDKGIKNGMVFSSHLPQMINTAVFSKAYKYFDARKYQYMICDWSMYFNYALRFHPDLFIAKPGPVICWPMNLFMAPSHRQAKEKLFENFYPDNYKENGIFYNLTQYREGDTNKLEAHNKKKIALFQKRFSSPKRIAALSAHLFLRLANILLSRKLIKFFYLAVKERECTKDFSKEMLLNFIHLHTDSFIPAMASRRWIHRGNRIDVVGLFDYPTGIGNSAKYLCKTIAAIEGAEKKYISRKNVSGYFSYPGVQSANREKIQSTRGGLAVFMLSPPQAKRIVQENDFKTLQHKKLINYVWYESNTIPENWKKALRYFDEIWVDNSFIQGLLAPGAAELQIPIAIRPLIPEFTPPLDMGHIFSDSRVSILTAFNLNSGFFRKNPTALIQAFKLLPKAIQQQAELVVKIDNNVKAPGYKELVSLSQEHGFKLIRDTFSDAELSGLIQGCDIYVSLHRLEGLGLLPMQAMALGKAIMATGWSGNMSYMDGKSACLIDYSLQKNNALLKDKIPCMVASDRIIFGADVVYADPNIDAATVALERLILDTRQREQLGRRARVQYQSYIQSVQRQWREEFL